MTEERVTLEQLLRRGQHATRKLPRACLLLKDAAGLGDAEIAAAVDTSVPTVERIRKRLATAGLKTLTKCLRPGKKPVLAPTGEARLNGSMQPSPSGALAVDTRAARRPHMCIIGNRTIDKEDRHFKGYLVTPLR
jgi:hypothetical protein